MIIIMDGIEVDESELDELHMNDWVDPNEMEEPVLVLDEDGFYVPDSDDIENDCQ